MMKDCGSVRSLTLKNMQRLKTFLTYDGLRSFNLTCHETLASKYIQMMERYLLFLHLQTARSSPNKLLRFTLVKVQSYTFLIDVGVCRPNILPIATLAIGRLSKELERKF